ncbi:MAG TPA: endolytic transglycosylase MltG, partial [Marmoricola sp.]|nr:endolytic transglycosylase MltG [Marmoricola sp.]
VPILMAGFLGLIILAVAGFYAWDRVGGVLGFAPDYSGPGTGQVSFEVHQGDSLTAIGNNLVEAGVVKSTDAFVKAARGNEKATGIQVGFYQLKREMKAADALEVLVDHQNLIKSRVLVKEGMRVRDILATIVEESDIAAKDLDAALENPTVLGLPPEANGNPEGWLFPATYDVTPGMTATKLLSQMIAKTISTLDSLDVASRARSKGLTVDEVLTVASIAQLEANRSEDYPKVTRVVYNRLDAGMPLQLDSTVSYLTGRKGDVWTTAAERQSDSLYNTYKNTGLPPGPIGSPGRETIEAALNSASGDWLYFVVDYESNKVLFTADYSEHLKNVERTKEYCRKSDQC